MEIRVLGPLEVWANGSPVPLGGPKQQTVLALLAVNADHWVGKDELVDELWPLGPPSSALANVGGYASKVRRLLAHADGGRDRVIRSRAGYLLRTTPGELDLRVFEGLAKEGRNALRNGEPTVAAARFVAARRRWRGAILPGLTRGSRLNARCTAAEHELVSVTEDLAGLYLTLDQPDEAVGLLREHVRLHPLREAAYALLMRALHRSGDSAGALASFADARRALVDQLGLEPGTELRELQRAILNQDRTLTAGRTTRPAERARPAGGTGQPFPREIPADVGQFGGRAPEVDRAHGVLVGGAGSERRRATLVVVHGPAGAGKSALAVRIAHRVAEHFPDGQLYVDLLGSGLGLRPRSTSDVLNRILRSLGTPPDDIPRNVSDAAATLRTMTADRRLLMVLDNADDAAQVNTVLPASRACGVVVTSRRPLSEVDSDCRMRIAGLAPTDGLALLLNLTTGIALDRITAERILTLCEYLPLAIRVAAGRLTRRPDLSAHDFADRLADERRRLDELELDGLAMRSCIRASYEALALSELEVRRLAARTLRTLAFLNLERVDEDVVGDVLGHGSSARVRAVLEVLVGDELVEPLPGGAYRLPDLVRLAAVEEAAELDDGGTGAGRRHGEPVQLPQNTVLALTPHAGRRRRAGAPLRSANGSLRIGAVPSRPATI
jgi:DNA-binding SARP family transcriptional activator